MSHLMESYITCLTQKYIQGISVVNIQKHTRMDTAYLYGGRVCISYEILFLVVFNKFGIIHNFKKFFQCKNKYVAFSGNSIICWSWTKVARDENKKVAQDQIVKNLDYQARVKFQLVDHGRHKVLSSKRSFLKLLLQKGIPRTQELTLKR